MGHSPHVERSNGRLLMNMKGINFTTGLNPRAPMIVKQHRQQYLNKASHGDLGQVDLGHEQQEFIASHGGLDPTLNLAHGTNYTPSKQFTVCH